MNATVVNVLSSLRGENYNSVRPQLLLSTQPEPHRPLRSGVAVKNGNVNSGQLLD